MLLHCMALQMAGLGVAQAEEVEKARLANLALRQRLQQATQKEQ